MIVDGIQGWRPQSIVWLFVVVVLCKVVYSNVEYLTINDSRLCNNGNAPKYRSTLCKHRKGVHWEGAEYICDQRQIPAKECRAVEVEMNEFRVVALLKLVPTVDEDSTIRRVVVRLIKNPLNFSLFGKEIDQFLTGRPWWYIHREPYSWNVPSPNVVVLHRVQHMFEPKLRLLSALQYPQSQIECDASPLMLNRRDFRHPGWYSMLSMYSSIYELFPYAITAMYITLQNNVNDSTAFVTGSDCPETVNKWECAFLSTTNCDLPDLITQCSSALCVQSSISDTVRATILFDKANKNGTPIDSKDAAYENIKVRSKIIPSFNVKFMTELLKWNSSNLFYNEPEMKYIRPIHPHVAPFQSMMFVKLDLYTYSFLLRYSYFYRAKIQDAIHHFRSLNDFSVDKRCVAAQIRRGDRVLSDGGNITEFCFNTSHPTTDYGCATVPFQSVTLLHVVNSAELLVGSNVRVLFVSTDDEEWLNTQKVQLSISKPDWKVYNLNSPKYSSSGRSFYEYMRYGAGTDSGVLLHASIEMSRQCEAFVGHFGCGGTMLMYKAMCARHNHREYVCPPSFDVRTIEELQIHKPKK